MQVGAGELTPLHDELVPIMKLHPKKHLYCTFVALQNIGPQSQKEEFAFSALIQVQVHLQDF